VKILEIEFREKTVMITGASGHVGTALAEAYAKSGAAGLVLTDVAGKEKDLEYLAAGLQSRFGKVGISTYYADLTDTDEIISMTNHIKKDKQGIDVLVNNAGINVLQKASEVTEEIWDHTLDLNLKGAFFLTQRIAADSLIDRQGSIVFIASQHGVVGNIMRAAYCASKSAVCGLVRALAADWSAFDVRVNAVSPTYIINDDNETLLMSAEFKRKFLRDIPLRRYARPEDVADAVLFVSSHRASMITGQNILVDGGYTAL